MTLKELPKIGDIVNFRDTTGNTIACVISINYHTWYLYTKIAQLIAVEFQYDEIKNEYTVIDKFLISNYCIIPDAEYIVDNTPQEPVITL